MSNELVGCWRVKSIDMVVGRAVSLIGGLSGELVEFTADGYYRVDIEHRRPLASLYRSESSECSSKLDIWIKGLESYVMRCIYKIDENLLTICVAGNSGERPTDFRRDDERLWCLIEMEQESFQRRYLKTRK